MGRGARTSSSFRAFRRAAFLFFALRAFTATGAAAFISSSISSSSSRASPAEVSVALRNGIDLPSFSNTDSITRIRPDRAIAPSTSSKSSRVISPRGHTSACSFPVDRPPPRSASIASIGHALFVRSRRLAEALPDATHGVAEIADAAGLAAVRQIAEVAHQGRHAALAGLGVAHHQVELLLLLLALRDVGFAPVIVPAG